MMNLDIMKVMKFFGMAHETYTFEAMGCLKKSSSFAVLVEQAYHPDNCYHNCTHAADVTQALHCLLSEPKVHKHKQARVL